MIIKLTKSQFDYLSYSLAEEQEVLSLKLQVKKEAQFVFVEADDSTIDEVRDWAMDKQVNIGFDINYELTPEGKILEELIDIFYTG